MKYILIDAAACLRFCHVAAVGAAFALALLVVPCHAQVVDGNVIMDQRMEENLCALTFDDGPSPNTGRLLDMLGAYGIPATFFLLGRQAELYPDLVSRMVAEGHEVGNHSYSHPNLRRESVAVKNEQIRQTDAILRSLGATPLYLRPPYGSFDMDIVSIADELGLSIILWSLDSRDWKRLPDDYAALRSTRGTVYEPGSLHGIFLFHDTHKTTVEDLPRIISQLLAGGCQRFVTVSEYLGGIPDLEPAVRMTRHDGATRSPAEPPRSYAAGSAPLPMARCSQPWQESLTEAPDAPLPGVTAMSTH